MRNKEMAEMNKLFWVEGRYFENSLEAFTFAWIQADRMARPVSVYWNQVDSIYSNMWYATAQPSNYVRSHKVTSETAPMELHPALEMS